MPIRLTKDQRGSWASSPSEMSAFLINIAEFVIEIIAPKELKNSKTEYAKIFSQVSEKIIQYINPQNFKLMALSGAYFRHIKSNNVIEWGKEDDKELSILLYPYLNGASGSQYLDSFSTSGKSASEAHCAFLRRILFPDLESLTQDKHYGAQVDILLTSAIKVIDFLTTPYAVLFEEADNQKKTTSGIDLQWSSMQKAVKSAVITILDSKSKSSLLLPVGPKPISSKMKKHQEQIDKDLQIFHACLGVENIRLEMQERYNKLQNEFKDLQKKYDELDSYIRQITPTPDNFTPKQRIQAYGNLWKDSYEKLKKENFKAPLDEALIEQDKLRQQLKEKEKEIQQWIEKYSQQEKLIAQLQEQRDQQAKEQTSLAAKANERDEAQSLITSQNNPQKLSLINWIKNLLAQIAQLTQSNEKLKKQVDKLKQDQQKLIDDNESLKTPFRLEIPEPSLPPPLLPLPLVNASDAVPLLGEWAKLLRSHCLGTNSTGVKDIMTTINKLQKDGTMNDTEKLSLLSIKMRQIAGERKDSSWSKSHFFGKGRHSGIQKLYDLMAENGFSLHTKGYCDRLKGLLNKEHFIHQKNQGNEETQRLLVQ